MHRDVQGRLTQMKGEQVGLAFWDLDHGGKMQ